MDMDLYTALANCLEMGDMDDTANDQVATGPEQVIHLTAPGEAALLACLEALLPPAFDARTLIDIGAVYVDRERCVRLL